MNLSPNGSSRFEKLFFAHDYNDVLGEYSKTV